MIMASKYKGTSRKQQFFSELDALIADAESVSLDAKSSSYIEQFQHE